jgi:uncharacterized membrane protein YccC
MRWSLLKKPDNLSAEEKQALAALESEETGCVHRFRTLIRQLVHIFDHTHSEVQAKLRLHQLRKDIHALEDQPLHQVTAQVVKTRITLQLATLDRLREAETEPLHPVGRLHMRR